MCTQVCTHRTMCTHVCTHRTMCTHVCTHVTHEYTCHSVCTQALWCVHMPIGVYTQNHVYTPVTLCVHTDLDVDSTATAHAGFYPEKLFAFYDKQQLWVRVKPTNQKNSLNDEKGTFFNSSNLGDFNFHRRHTQISKCSWTGHHDK